MSFFSGSYDLREDRGWGRERKINILTGNSMSGVKTGSDLSVDWFPKLYIDKKDEIKLINFFL